MRADYKRMKRENLISLVTFSFLKKSLAIAAIVLIFLTGSESAQYVDLAITDKSEEWVDANKTYNITYTIANLLPSGAGKASTSGIYIDGNLTETHSEPKLKGDHNRTVTVGPFRMSGENDTIKICADYNGKIEETSEINNCTKNIFYYFGQPEITITDKSEEWVDLANKRYNITYTVKNIGDTGANASTASIYIDGVNVGNDSVPALKVAERHNSTIGPFEVSNKNDTIKICADINNEVNESNEGNNCKENTFVYSEGCLADDGTLFSCGDTVTKSCTLDGCMCCPAGHGLIIGIGNITIDGADYAITGDRSACPDPGTPGPEDDDDYPELTYCGILNYNSSMDRGYDNVVIKNLEIRDFCDGIGIKKAVNNTIEKCVVHDNGNGERYTYGINVVNSDNTTIDTCRVYNNTGLLTDDLRTSGGHGICLHDESNYCNVTNSFVANNYLSGIWASSSCKHLYIVNNTVKENGYCGESDDFCAGINLHWETGSTEPSLSTVEHNTILNNTGSGILVAQHNTTIKNNIVKRSKNGTSLKTVGHGLQFYPGGIRGDSNYVYNNTFCDNECVDIYDGGIGNFGDENTCDTRSNYNDEGTRGCMYYCAGVSGVCAGTTKDFSCGDLVTESCTFNKSMRCPAGDGLIIGADNITIDGAGYTISGASTDCAACSRDDPENGCCGILNRGYNCVVIRNLQVKDFCTGIIIENVEDNTIDNCNVRDNGDNTGLTHGMLLWNTDNSTVSNSRIYRNIGNYTGDTDTGGHGIKLCNDSDYNSIRNNTVYNNYASAIFGMSSQHNDVANNTVRGNDFGGGIRLSYDANYWAVEHNTITDNTGPGIFVGGDNNSFRYNIVKRNKNGTFADISTKGHGIFFRFDVNNNTIKSNIFGDNECIDIYNDDGPSNTGAENRCDSTYNYDDEGTSDGCTYGYTIDLIINEKKEGWVNLRFRIYRINYTVKNIGEWTASASNTSIVIDGTEVEETDAVPALAPNENYTNSVGPFAMSGDSDTIKVCADKDNDVIESNEDNNSLENRFVYEESEGEVKIGVCVGTTKCFKCRDTVTESCRFNGSMICPAGHGLIVGTEGITINGAGCKITGTGTESCAGISATNPSGGDCGILNKGYDNVVIINLEVEKFCNGIGLHGTGQKPVKNNTIDNCNVHHNGNATFGMSHGIHLCYVGDSWITDNNIHHNTGAGTGCEDGGNGIFLYAGSANFKNNVIAQNKLHNNRKGGFFAKMVSQHNNITGNSVHGNGQAGIILRCMKSSFNRIESNTVAENYGDGIFIGGEKNIIKDNTVRDNKAGFRISSTDTVGDGDGIDMGRSDGSFDNELYNNVVCDNEGTDIDTYGAGSRTIGDDNICDSTNNDYNDNETIGCTWNCSPLILNIDIIPIEIAVPREKNTITATIENRGTDGVKDLFNVSLFEEGIEDPVDTKGISSLAAGYTSKVNLTWKQDTPGNSKLIVFADADRNIDETNEGNNMKEILLLPDLNITAIHVSSVSLSVPGIISVNIENIGIADVEKAFNVSLDVNGAEVDKKKVEESIARSNAKDIEFKWTPVIAGNYTLRIVSDCDGDIEESNEINNEKELLIKIIHKENEPPIKPGKAGGRPLAREETVSGYESELGAGTGEEGAGGVTKQLPINESETESGKEKIGKGHPFGKGRMIETVKVVAPMFLIVPAIILIITLFYLGYYKEKREHRRNKKT